MLNHAAYIALEAARQDVTPEELRAKSDHAADPSRDRPGELDPPASGNDSARAA